MWHSLHKSVQAVDLLLRFSVAVSVGLHVLCIILVVVMHYVRPAHQITIQRNTPLTTEVTIIIDPRASSYARATADGPVTGVVMDKPAQSSQMSASTKTESQKPVTTIVNAPAVKMKSQTKQQASKQKSKPKTASKKSAPKKLPKSKLAKPVKKSSFAKASADMDKPRIETPQQAPAQQVPQTIELPAHIDGPIMIARNVSDAAVLSVQLEIQQELVRVWCPPVGIEEGISCTIKVVLENDGTVKSLEIVKPSGMMLFDVSARAAIQQAVWPRAVWGTTLELCLQ